MKIIAMLNRSAGNAEVGSMWTETKVFDYVNTVGSFIERAQSKLGVGRDSITERLTLQILQEPEEVQ